MTRWTGLLLAQALMAWTVSAAPDFSREVRPILSNNCFKCHGPDDKERKAKMRLDLPGKAELEEVVARITSDDPDEKMPPPESNKTLNAAQIGTLKAWIDAGAKYEKHWAFVAPMKAPLPAGAHPVDHFVGARLQEAGLDFSPRADRLTLVRRVYLDLVGLPPTPEEADAFVSDESPDAWEKLVDRLLESPRYGERWARRWLDLARYADTNGYEKDRDRSIWPYRDWVIDALNADMPFDQFTIEQLAGDMLPNPTRQQLIATGFHRNTMLNEEGGIDPLEFRFYAMTDRVATTGTTWLGLTLGCAQCHTHKYDPLTHTEYYQIMALMNNADEPELPLSPPGSEEQRAKDLAESVRLLAELPSKWPLPGEDSQRDWKVVRPVEASADSGQKPKILDDHSLLFADPTPEKDTYTIEFETDAPRVDALRLETLTHDDLPSRGPGRTPHGNFVLSEIEVMAGPAKGEKSAKVKLVGATASVEQPKFGVASAIDGQLAGGWGVHDPGKPLNADRHAVFRFGEPLGFAAGTRFTVRLRQELGSGHTIGRVRLSIPEAAKPGRNEGSSAVGRKRAMVRSFVEWMTNERDQNTRWSVLKPTGLKTNLPLLVPQPDGSIFASGDNTKHDVYTLTYTKPGPANVIRLEALPDERLPDGGPGTTFYEGRKGDFFLTEFRLSVDGVPVKIGKADQTYAKNRFGNNPVSAQLATDGDLQTGWSVADGIGERHVAVFNLEKSLPADARELVVEMHFGRHYSSSLGRFRIGFGQADKPLPATTLSNAVIDALMKPRQKTSPREQKLLMNAFLLQAPEVAEHAKRIRELRKPKRHGHSLVMRERPASNPRPTHRHHRGEFTQPKEPVVPGTPEALHASDDAPRDRLGFAKWLVARDNPLTARVVVNRHWQAFFGMGIVRTVGDFGVQGEFPSHPQLLDWLAVEFMDKGWSVKQLHRLLVTSETYRQQSIVADREGDIRLLSRFPRTRLEAEIIRDSALRAAGLLNEKMHGPPVRPPQPAGVTEVAYGSPKWSPSGGAERFRRSLYTYQKRTAPFAMFTTFDGGSGEACIAQRDRSNSPLQALTLMNDPMFLEIAEAFGKSIAARDGENSAKIVYAFRRVLTRRPSADELASLLAFQGRHQNWTALARALLSLDEAVTKG